VKEELKLAEVVEGFLQSRQLCDKLADAFFGLGYFAQRQFLRDISKRLNGTNKRTLLARCIKAQQLSERRGSLIFRL
jgi:hypothetical protein